MEWDSLGKNFGQLRKVPVGKGGWVIVSLTQDRQGKGSG